MICIVPQPIKTAIKKDVSGISSTMWWLQIGGYIFGLLYGLQISQWPLIIGSVFGFVVSLLFLVLYYKYRESK